MGQEWSGPAPGSLSGRNAIVTGANRGLGYEIALALAGAGAHVVLACRDARRAEAAAAAIQQRHPHAQLRIAPIDLAQLDSVRAFASEMLLALPSIDLLVNNGAVILVPQGKTVDGFERHFAVNHLAPFALTGLLLERLQRTPGARVLNTASLAHRLTPGLDLDDPHFERRPYKEMEAYGASKLAALAFTFELDRRLRRRRSELRAVAAHPGYTATNPDTGGFFMRLATRIFAQSPPRGALPALYAATADGVAGGDYYGPDGMKELRGGPRKVAARPEASDPVLGARLWALSEQLTGVRYLDSTG